MNNAIIRARGFGKISCQGISEKSERMTSYLREEVPDEKYDTIFRWGYRGNIPQCRLEVNTTPAMGLVGDKGKFRELCAEEGLAPRTYRTFERMARHMLLGKRTPLVIRPIHHKQGKNLHVIKDMDEAVAAAEQYSEWYASELIDKVCEYRAVVVQGRILFIYEKVPDDRSQVAWNHAQGGTSEVLKWSNWPSNVVENAIRSFNLSGLSFGAVDIMVDRDGNAYCLEINTAPETTSEYRQKCFAKAFNYILDRGADPIPVVFGRDWKGYIHPAMTELAVQ